MAAEAPGRRLPSFLWIVPAITRTRALGRGVVPELPAHDGQSADIEEIGRRFGRLWHAEVARAAGRHGTPSLVRVIWQMYGDDRTVLVAAGIGFAAVQVAIPLVASWLIRAIADDAPLDQSLPLVAALAGLVLAGTFVQQHCWYMTNILSGHAWIGLTTLVYQMPSRLTRASLSRFSEGALVNVVSSDAQAYLEISQFFYFWVSMPFLFLFSSALLFYLLRWIFIVALAALVVQFLSVTRLAGKVKDATIRKNRASDGRLTLINETLQGARAVKLYHWEDLMASRIARTRDVELAELRRIGLLRALILMLSLGLPSALLVPVFLLYRAVHGDIPADLMFATIASFEILALALAVAPNIVNESKRVVVSLTRVRRFVETPAGAPGMAITMR